MFSKVLVANRGEIACRVLRTLDAMGAASVAVYSEADADAPHVALAGEARCIGPAAVKDSYLRADAIVRVARETGAEAVHPGYGLLSENAAFAEACEAAGIAFIGPTPEQMTQFGLKHEARRIAKESEVPLLEGSPLLDDTAAALKVADEVGYPVMLKSTAGGGGIGMQVCHDAAELEAAFEKVERLGQAHFGQGGVFLEKFVEHARHLEVQIFGDGQGGVHSLGVRDCSAQRRNQKVIEETPPPGVPEETQRALQEAAIRLASAVRYRSAGTVEFIYDNDAGTFYFLEVNTRLQVEHGVTELVTGVDLVRWMVELAAGEWTPPGGGPFVPRQGHAIQARLYAEDPLKDFQPSSGLLTEVRFPEGVRCDHWIDAGAEVTPYYDPLLAKVQVFAEDRAAACQGLSDALAETRLSGIETNLHYLREIAASDVFRNGAMVTRTLAGFVYQPNAFEVLRSGTMTTVQDVPGRTGYWEVGVPPSGPMDSLALRMANRFLGNPEGAAGLEITATGPKLRFHRAVRAAICGADMEPRLNGDPVALNQAFVIPAGGVLDIGKASGVGIRCYLALAGGIDVPEYLGSKSTFTLGQFGGHGGRALRLGDVLYLAEAFLESVPNGSPKNLPALASEWEIGVLYGPHGAPDFFTDEDIRMFFETAWEVHYNSARTGVRLIGPKPTWARSDGGEAGLHPSNIHDNAYAVGAIDFTGDMPVILGPDGPSLGGFVCPATVVQCELWKLGQLKPGDSVRFRCLSREDAESLRIRYDEYLVGAGLFPEVAGFPHRVPGPGELVLCDDGEGEERLVVRQAGDANVLAEIGPMVLDFRLRFHVHVLYEALRRESFDAVEDLTPGIRSLQVHFDPVKVSAESVAMWIQGVNASLPPLEDLEVPSRIVHLPLSWDDPATREAIDKYMQSVRPDAPWCPDNIEFIRRINGLDTRQDVHKVVFDASYVVLGLGDVYLGAPVATPLDPRHRLVTTKYNPARTWTPENAVGIGGAYLCVYGMEGPGGYQFVGRTVQMWNRYRTTPVFEPGKPWLLRFFDQIRFYPVSSEELTQLRRDHLQGRFVPRIEPATFSMGEYLKFVDENAAGVLAFKERQQAAFEEERARWEAAGLATFEEDVQASPATDVLEDGVDPVESPVAGSVWKILVTDPDAYVEAGETLAVLESMKMEIQLEAPVAGTLVGGLCREGQPVQPGQALFGIRPAGEEGKA